MKKANWQKPRRFERMVINGRVVMVPVGVPFTNAVCPQVELFTAPEPKSVWQKIKEWLNK